MSECPSCYQAYPVYFNSEFVDQGKARKLSVFFPSSSRVGKPSHVVQLRSGAEMS